MRIEAVRVGLAGGNDAHFIARKSGNRREPSSNAVLSRAFGIEDNGGQLSADHFHQARVTNCR